MEMHTNSSSFVSLTLQTTNSFRDVSFSSYLNKAEEQVIRKLTNQASDPTNDHHCRRKSDEDEELGVFGAEKYFKGEIEDDEDKNDQRFVDMYDIRSNSHQRDEKLEEFDQNLCVKRTSDQTNGHTPSVRSNISCTSRIGLLPRSKPSSGSKTLNFLANLGCNCKKSTQVSEKRVIKSKEIAKPHTRMLEFNPKTDTLSSQSEERKAKNDYFSFPVLNSNDLNSYSNSDRSNSKSTNLAGKVQGDNNEGRLSLGKKLSLLNNWESDIPTDDEVYIPSIGMYNDVVVESDSSSDLFEIESFSTTGNSFTAPRESESNCYAPSEVSVDWSVVTASAADFSVASDYEELRAGGGGGGWRISGRNDRVTNQKDDQKKRVGIISGCASHKAVRVAGDECMVGGGSGGGGGRRRLSESMAVGGMFRGGMV